MQKPHHKQESPITPCYTRAKGEANHAQLARMSKAEGNKESRQKLQNVARNVENNSIEAHDLCIDLQIGKRSKREHPTRIKKRASIFECLQDF